MKKINILVLSSFLLVSMLSGCNQKEKAYNPNLPNSLEKADIYVEKVEGISDDFIKGVDISTIISQEQSGVVYYNSEGREQDIFKTLADAGVNYIRVRVWNDPYNSTTGIGYGGGNCDINKAAIIGQRAAKYNMNLLVDFHYSDFWADPSNQKVPKSWQHYTINQKEKAIYNYTLDSLEAIRASGSKIGMVQIGNEINNGLAGETTEQHISMLLKEASRAVREFASSVNETIKVAVHYTDINKKDLIMSKAEMLHKYQVDYDIFGVSYYNYWHGSLNNLSDVLLSIKSKYNKETIVLETAYLSSLEDSDEFGNMVNKEHLVDGYGATYQSQAHVIRNIINATVKGNGLGVFYWEPAWIKVGDNFHSNHPIWEQYGSGCSSSASSEFYESDIYGGGSAWDNQALFDENGYPLPSLDTFKFVKYGAIAESRIDYVEDVIVRQIINTEVKLPTFVYTIYNNRNDSKMMQVEWNNKDISKVDTSQIGNYYIEGKIDNYSFYALVIIEYENLISNYSFEQSDRSMWEITAKQGNPTDYQYKKDEATHGDYSLHFWFPEDNEVSISQTVKHVAKGKYCASVNIQGDGAAKSTEIYLFLKINDTQYKSELVKIDGWTLWKTPLIDNIEILEGQNVTIGLKIISPKLVWGTIDEFKLLKIG